jgi:hypothetical protein
VLAVLLLLLQLLVLVLGLIFGAEGAGVQHTRQGPAQLRLLLARAVLQLAHLCCRCQRLPGLQGVNTCIVRIVRMLLVMLLLLLEVSCSRCCHGLCWPLLLRVLPAAAAGSPVQDGMPQPLAPVQEALVLCVLVLGWCCVLLGLLPVAPLLQHHMAQVLVKRAGLLDALA